MVKRRLREVIRMVGGAWTGTPEELDRWVSGVSTDTRTLTPGALFVPLVGTRFDGHQFVREALGRGASAFLWQRDRGVRRVLPLLSRTRWRRCSASPVPIVASWAPA
jgi:UDP-N-acetylmuramyl pentapeptide synthase